MKNGQYSNLSVVIVGGAAGLGSLLADLTAKEGARAVGIVDVNEEAANQTMAAIRSLGVKTAFVSCDIRTESACKTAFEKLMGEIGRVDTLINSAAIYPPVSYTHLRAHET